jgi:hypothetical protein
LTEAETRAGTEAGHAAATLAQMGEAVRKQVLPLSPGPAAAAQGVEGSIVVA